MASRWRYVGQLGVQDGQLGSILGAILAHLRHLGSNFIENCENTKTLRKPLVFKGFWIVRGVHFGVFGGHVGLCWCILALSWGILSELGNMMQHVATS